MTVKVTMLVLSLEKTTKLTTAEIKKIEAANGDVRKYPVWHRLVTMPVTLASLANKLVARNNEEASDSMTRVGFNDSMGYTVRESFVGTGVDLAKLAESYGNPVKPIIVKIFNPLPTT